MIGKIVSGGQTGADRAALDHAIEAGIPHGGWCPRGRLAEDGVIDPQYRLQESPDPEYAQRTEWNVRDSDGTVIFTVGRELVGGSLLTSVLARRHGKPLLHLSPADGNDAELAGRLAAFLEEHGIHSLNVAGPRASGEPDVGEFVIRILRLLPRS